MKAKFTDCNAALKRIYDRTDMGQIRAFINDVPYISDLQKDFYNRYITARHDLIIRPAVKIAMQDASEQSEQ